MDSSLIGLTSTSIGANGSAFLTGTGVWENSAGWQAFRTAATGVEISAITAPRVSGVDYLVGKTLTDPYEFLGHFTSITLAEGAIQAFN